MERIRLVRGTGRGPTELSAYDAALAEAGVHDYNLRRLSSVIPAGATLEAADRAPDLGPAGEALWVVEASAIGRSGPQSAVLSWARSPDGPGLFYEAGGPGPIEAVRAEALEGLAAGVELRERPYGEPETYEVTADADGAREYAAVVALAAYGSSEPLL